MGVTFSIPPSARTNKYPQLFHQADKSVCAAVRMVDLASCRCGGLGRYDSRFHIAY